MVGATFCRDLGVLEICLLGRDLADFPDTCRDLAHEAQIHDPLARLLGDALIMPFMVIGLTGRRDDLSPIYFRPFEWGSHPQSCVASYLKAEHSGRMTVPAARTGHHFILNALSERVVEKRNPLPSAHS